MLKITKVMATTALGLAIGLSSFAPSAFAQSVNQNTMNQIAVTQGVRPATEGWQGNNHHVKRLRCTHAYKWVRVNRRWKRVAYRSCRWS